jgi:hypothetical protein
LRAIVRTTGIDGEDSGHGHGRRVVLHQVPTQLLKVLRIVGWDATPGLAVDQPAGEIPPESAAPPEVGRPGSAAW